MMQLSVAVRLELLNQPQVVRIDPSRKHKVLFEAGRSVEQVFYLEKGIVKLFRQDNGSRELVFGLVRQDEIFALSNTLQPKVAPYSAVMLTDGIVHAIPCTTFQQFIDQRPYAWRWFAELIQHQEAAHARRLEILGLPEVEQRLRALIPMLADYCRPAGSTEKETTIPLKQQEIASLVGATRETTSTTLNVLAREGFLQIARGRIIFGLGSQNGHLSVPASVAQV